MLIHTIHYTPPVLRSPIPAPQHADVGEEMNAYFDKDTKRWVFPGQPAEEATAAAPSAPPTASQLGAPSSQPGEAAAAAPTPTPGLDANDPLAALMAPPKASLGPRRHTAVGQGVRGGGPSGGPPSGGLSWAKSTRPPLSGGGAARSPFPPPGGNFTVFAPKPAPVSSSGGGHGGGSSPDAQPETK